MTADTDVNGNTTDECVDCRALPVIVVVGPDGPVKRRREIKLCRRCHFKRDLDASDSREAMAARG